MVGTNPDFERVKQNDVYNIFLGLIKLSPKNKHELLLKEWQKFSNLCTGEYYSSNSVSKSAKILKKNLTETFKKLKDEIPLFKKVDDLSEVIGNETATFQNALADEFVQGQGNVPVQKVEKLWDGTIPPQKQQKLEREFKGFEDEILK